MIVIKMFPEGEPNKIIYIGTTCKLSEWFNTDIGKTYLINDKLRIEPIPTKNVEKEVRIMREFSTTRIVHEGDDNPFKND